MTNHRARTIAASLAAVLCAVLATDNALGQCSYEISAIIQGPPCSFGGDFAPLVGRGLNSHGHVAGSWADCDVTIDEAFYWTPETGLVTLPRPAGVWSAIATDINDNGLIVGRHAVNGVGWTGFVYDPSTRAFTYLQPLHPGVTATTVSTINAINSAGIAAGSRIISKPGVVPVVSNAVIWNTNTGEVIDLGVGEGPNSTAVDGNDGTNATGYSGTAANSLNARALLWLDNDTIELGTLPDGEQSSATAMNNVLQVVGRSRVLDPNTGLLIPEGFLWIEGEMFHIPRPDGYNIAFLQGISDALQVVGTLRILGPSNIDRGFLWQHGTFHVFDDLLVNPPDDLTINSASIAASDGTILANGSGMGVVAAVLRPLSQPIGDLNHDCSVDVHDLLILLDAWGPIVRAKRQTGSPADLNGDGVVDVSDLLILLANWSN